MTARTKTTKAAGSKAPAKGAAKSAVVPAKTTGAEKKSASAKPAAEPKASAKPTRAQPRAKAKRAAPISPEQRRAYVEVAAYYIAERRGFAPGDSIQDWTQAEAEIERLLLAGMLGKPAED